jgi:nitrogen regulatory protein P-II 1
MALMRVEAIIQPERLDGLLAALEEKGFVSMTVSDVVGRGEQRGIKLRYNGRAERSKLLSKVRIELVVCDYEVDFLIETIAEAVRTGNIGDGRIFVSPVTRSIKLRSGEDMAELETQSSEDDI